MEETMKYRDAAYSKAQREKLHNDFLNFYNNEFFPTQRDSSYKTPSKACFHKKGQEYLDSVSENRYLSYSVSSRKHTDLNWLILSNKYNPGQPILKPGFWLSSRPFWIQTANNLYLGPPRSTSNCSDFFSEIGYYIFENSM